MGDKTPFYSNNLTLPPNRPMTRSLSPRYPNCLRPPLLTDRKPRKSAKKNLAKLLDCATDGCLESVAGTSKSTQLLVDNAAGDGDNDSSTNPYAKKISLDLESSGIENPEIVYTTISDVDSQMEVDILDSISTEIDAQKESELSEKVDSALAANKDPINIDVQPIDDGVVFYAGAVLKSVENTPTTDSDFTPNEALNDLVSSDIGSEILAAVIPEKPAEAKDEPPVNISEPTVTAPIEQVPKPAEIVAPAVVVSDADTAVIDSTANDTVNKDVAVAAVADEMNVESTEAAGDSNVEEVDSALTADKDPINIDVQPIDDGGVFDAEAVLKSVESTIATDLLKTNGPVKFQTESIDDALPSHRCIGDEPSQNVGINPFVMKSRPSVLDLNNSPVSKPISEKKSPHPKNLKGTPMRMLATNNLNTPRKPLSAQKLKMQHLKAPEVNVSSPKLFRFGEAGKGRCEFRFSLLASGNNPPNTNKSTCKPMPSFKNGAQLLLPEKKPTVAQSQARKLVKAEAEKKTKAEKKAAQRDAERKLAIKKDIRRPLGHVNGARFNDQQRRERHEQIFKRAKRQTNEKKKKYGVVLEGVALNRRFWALMEMRKIDSV